MPEAMKRVEAVRKFRSESTSAPTIKLAQTPTRFHVENMPNTDAVLIPRHSSESRKYIPIGFIPKEYLIGDSCIVLPNATLYGYGILISGMHMAWTRSVCGRLKSDYRYSVGIVYNNFPWPSPSDQQRGAIENAARAVLDARNKYPNSSLADLYDPLTMPKELVAAHNNLDAVVEKAYGKRFASDAERVSFLFQRHSDIVGAVQGDSG
jgi:sulfur carrier protein ThiS